MKLFFDLEFTGLHKTTNIMSIGIISEDGKKFYAEINDYDKSQVNDWLEQNVIKHFSFNYQNVAIPKMPVCMCNNYACKQSFEDVRETLNTWLNQFDEIQFVSDVCHYDFVLMIDLISGHALDLPINISAVCHDINQDIAAYHKISDSEAFDLSREEFLINNSVHIKGEKHNALYDAKVIRAIYDIVNKE